MTDETMPYDDAPTRSDAETLPSEDGTSATTSGSDKTISYLFSQKGIHAGQVNLKAGRVDVQLDEKQRYVIGAELARGGMGAVLNATDVNLRRDIAMKVVLDAKAAKDSQIVRFVHEAQVTGQLEHPSIVPVYELGVDAQDHVYYTMKYIRGTNLGEIIAGLRDGDPKMIERYPLPRLLNIFIKGCEAMAFSHSRGVIHRDLKPDNIMVGDFGEVLVVDWGLAKVLGADPDELSEGQEESAEAEATSQSRVESIRHGDDRTMQGSIMGTPAYMPPEQADGDMEKMGPPADVYSMGGILYTILTLEAPIIGKNVEELLRKVREGAINPPLMHEGTHPHCPQGKIPPSLSSVAMKAMSLELDDRYPSMQALQTDVQAYLDGFATSAEEANLWRLVQLFVARHRALVTVGVSAFVLLTVVIATSLVVNIRERERAENALAAFQEEQARGRETRRVAAPALVEAANTLIHNDQLEGAALQAELAREYDPTFAPAHLLSGQILMVQGDYPAAITPLQQYVRLRPEDAEAAQLLELSLQAETMPKVELNVAVAKRLIAQKQARLARHLELDAKAAMEIHLAQLRAAYPDAKPGFGRRADGLISGGRNGITNLEGMQGLPIGDIVLYGPEVTDLEPLRGAPMKYLYLKASRVSDLSPLQGAPLEQLFLEQNQQLVDLSPLRGAPIKELTAKNLPIDDLSFAEGMPLEQLDISSTRITDLSPIAGAPLRHFQAYVSSLRNIEALRGAPLESANLWRTNVEDLSPLAGAPLQRLNISTSKVTDLSPLANMPLIELNIDNLETEDLSVLLTLKDLERVTVSSNQDLRPLLDRLPKLQQINGKPVAEYVAERALQDD